MASRIRILLLVSALAVICAVGAITYVAYQPDNTPPVEQPAPVETVADSPVPTAPDSPPVPPAPQQDVQLPVATVAPIAEALATASAPAAPDDSPVTIDEPIDAELESRPAFTATVNETTGTITTSVNHRALASGDAFIPLAAEAKAMSLTDGQRAAIDQFDAAFQPDAKAQLDQQAKDVRFAMEEVKQAVLSGDQAFLEQASQRVRNVSNDQASLVRQLNQKYLDGIRGFLSAEQVQTLEKSVNQVGGAWQSGIVRSPRIEKAAEPAPQE